MRLIAEVTRGKEEQASLLSDMAIGGEVVAGF
jgi:hypothetical protein